MKDKLCPHRFLAWFKVFRGESLVEQGQHCACLRIRLADNHSGYLWSILLDAELPYIVDDIVQQSIEVVGGFDDLVVVYIGFLYLNVVCESVKNVFYLFLVFCLYIFTHQTEGIAVGDGFVVIVFVDIIAENLPGGAFLFQERRSGQGNLHTVPVCVEEVCKETAGRIVAAMGFVDEEYTNEVDVVCLRQVYLLVIFFKLLDVHNHNFRLSVCVSDDGIAAEVVHQFFTAIGFSDI